MKLLPFVSLLAAIPLYGQAVASLVPMPRAQFFSASGVPLAGGCVWTYAAGSSTPLNSYKNAAGSANQNPVVLDSAGRADIWLGAAQAYKISVSAKTSAGCVAATTPLYTADNVIDQGFALARSLQNGSLTIGLRGLPITGQGGGVSVGNAVLSATTDGLYVSVNGAAPVLLSGGGGAGGGAAAGPATSLQYNGGGSPAALAGTANLKWDNGGRVLVICGAPATGCTPNSGVEAPTFSSFGAAGESGFETNVTGGAIGSSHINNDGNAYFQGVNVANTFVSNATGATLAITQASRTFNITGAGDAGFQTMGLGLHATPTTGFGGGVNVGEALLSATTAGLYLSLDGAPPALITGGGGSGTPGAPTTSIQFNNSGTFAGSPNLAWDSGGNVLHICTLVGSGCTNTSGLQAPLFSSFGAAGDKAFITNTSAGGVITGSGTSYITNDGNGFFQGVNVSNTFNSNATGATLAITQASRTFNITGAGDAGFQTMGLGLHATPTTGIGGGVGIGEARLSATTGGLYISLNGAAPVLVGGGGGSGTPGAPSTSIQFNNAGTFAGSANLLWDNTNGIMTLTKVGATSGIIAPIFNGNVTAGGNTFKNSDGSFTIDAAGNALFQTVRALTTFQSLATGAALALSTAGSPGASINGQGDGSFRSLAIAGGAYGLNNSGQLTVSSCIGCVGTAAGANTQVQFNNGGVFGASAKFTWSGDVVTVGGGSGTGVNANTFTANASGGAYGFQLANNNWQVDANGNSSQIGSLIVNAGASGAQMNLLGNNGTYRGVQYFTNFTGPGSTPTVRWYQVVTGEGESAGNSGSNWQLNRYSDTGALLGTPFAINRATGVVTIPALAVSSCTGCGAGVTSLTSSGNGITFSAATGAVTASLTQDLRTVGNPTFANLTVTSCTGCGGAPSGASAGAIQFYNGGVFGSYANLFWNAGVNILGAPAFNCSNTGASTCMGGGGGTWSIAGNGTFLGQSIVVSQSIASGTNNGTTATGGQGATISNNAANIGLVVYDTGGHCNIGTFSFACSSDERLKRNVVGITDALKAVTALRPVTFDWKLNGMHGAGFIAQEVQRVMPNLVTADKGGFLELNEYGMVPYLVRSIQELQAEVDVLRSRLNVRLLNEQLSK